MRLTKTRAARVVIACVSALAMMAAAFGFATPSMAAEPESGCKVYYPADTKINLATAAQDSDCWDSSMVSKQGRTFLGWSEEQIPDITSGEAYTSAQSKIVSQVTMVAPGKTVYAVWAAMPVLNYDVNTPAGSTPPTTPESITVEFNTPASDSSGWTKGDGSKIPGYTFIGWTDTPNGDDLHDWSQPLTSETTTVYAKWQANSYTVKFDKNADDATGTMSDQKFQYDVEQPLSTNEFDRNGYTFTGWNTKPNGSGTAYTDKQAVKNLISEDGGSITLYAQWKLVTVNLIFDANGGDGSHDPVKAEAFGEATIPDDVDESFNRDGWALVGWNTQKDGNGTFYSEGNRIPMGAEDTTLYAVWIRAIESITPSTGGEGWTIPMWTLPAGAGGLLVLVVGIAAGITRKHQSRSKIGHLCHGEKSL